MEGASQIFPEIETPQGTESVEVDANTDRNDNIDNTAQDRKSPKGPNHLPITNLTRIMRRIIPHHVKISDAAKGAMRDCVVEYIAFVTTEASHRCQVEQRKTVAAEDILWALYNLGFEDYVGPLTLFLQRYRESEGDFRTPKVHGPPIKHVDLSSLPLTAAYQEADLFSCDLGNGDAGPSGTSLIKKEIDHSDEFAGIWGRKEKGGEEGKEA